MASFEMEFVSAEALQGYVARIRLSENKLAMAQVEINLENGALTLDGKRLGSARANGNILRIESTVLPDQPFKTLRHQMGQAMTRLGGAVPRLGESNVSGGIVRIRVLNIATSVVPLVGDLFVASPEQLDREAENIANQFGSNLPDPYTLWWLYGFMLQRWALVPRIERAVERRRKARFMA